MKKMVHPNISILAEGPLTNKSNNLRFPKNIGFFKTLEC
jgi:hypothetical protein